MLQAQKLGVWRLSVRRISESQKPPRKNKLYQACVSVSRVKDGATVLVGGYGLCGCPDRLLLEIDHHLKKDLTIVCCDAGNDEGGLGELLRHRRVKRLITAHVGHSQLAQEQFESGHLELQLVPQGTLAERVRAGAAGIPAFFTPVGVGTSIEEGGQVTVGGKLFEISAGKEGQHFDGRRYILEEALRGDYALVRAWKADMLGNLCFRGSTRGFNESMCGAARVTVAQVEDVVPVGGIPPEAVHVPGAFVQKIVKETGAPRLERLTLWRDTEKDKKDEKESVSCEHLKRIMLNTMLRRVAWEMQNRSSVHLGPGFPSELTQLIIPNPKIRLHTRSGVLGIGPFPSAKEQAHADLVDGSKRTVMALDGITFMSSHQSAAMLRGGHVELVVVGAVEVSGYGDLAADPIDAINGAMDAAAAHAAGSRVVAVMSHLTAEGNPRLVTSLEQPMTAQTCLDLIITDKAVFEVDAERGLHLIELAQDVLIEDVAALTGAQFTVTDSIQPIKQLIPDPKVDADNQTA